MRRHRNPAVRFDFAVALTLGAKAGQHAEDLKSSIAGAEQGGSAAIPSRRGV